MGKLKENASILITDDDTKNRVELTALLHIFLHNTHVQQALNGEEAVKLVTEKIEQTGSNFDLIFMDFQMPGINGEVTTATIRNIEKQFQVTPSIIITWSSAKNSPYPYADDWIPKPAQKRELQYILETYDFLPSG